MNAASKKPPQDAPPKLVPAPALALRKGRLVAAFGSTALHLALAGGLLFLAAQPQKKAPESVRVKINEVKKAPPPAPPPPPEAVAEKKPEPPKPKKPPEKKRASERKPATKPPQKPAAPVQGLSASAVSPNGTGIAAPVGNTLMVEDDGKRLKPEDVRPLADEDLSADASLIRTSVPTPAYTDAALDAELEGTYTVEVFVDAAGAVTDAQLPKKIGYGMDEKVLVAARQAHFHPRKDKFGRPIPGWTDMKFRLEIPH